MAPTEKDSSVPLKQRSSDYYELHFTEASGLPPGTDTIDQVKNNPRQPRPPPDAIRTLPPLPPKSERKGRWIDSYLDKLDPTTEYDQIIRVCTFFRGSDFATAIGYAAVFVWLTATPGGANAIHGGKVTTRGHQRYYETQLFNLRWVFHGAGSPETKKYCEQINKVHTGIWNRVPGAFSFPWEAQNAIILLSYYETLMRRIVGADNEIHPKLKEAWPAWGERLTAHLKSEPQAGSVSFGCNYPRNWNELENFVEWFQEFDYSDQCTEEDRIKGYETAESFIDQFSELWFPRPLKFVGRAIMLTFVPARVRRKQRLEDPNPVLEWLIKAVFRWGMNYGDRQPDPVEAPLEKFFDDLQHWDLKTIDQRESKYRDRQVYWIIFTAAALFIGGTFMLFAVGRGR